MAHERQLLRDAVVAQLIGPPPYTRTAAGQHVYKTRNGPVREGDLPCICVFVGSETAEDGSMTYVREATLTVEGYVKAAPSADLDAAMDDLALQIETALDIDRFVAGTACDTRLSSTTLETSMLGSQPMGRVALDYRCTYETPFRGPAPLDAFVTADVHHSIGGVQAPADQAHDTITLAQ